MIRLKVSSFKAGFFDREAVLKRLDSATRRALSRFGAFVRTRARSSIRKRKRPSAPGTPPSSHTGNLRKFLFFAYEPSRQSVVIGPAKLGAVVSDTAPEALEYGGPSTVFGGSRRARTRKTVRIKARPFMNPALEAELPRLPQMWRDSVR